MKFQKHIRMVHATEKHYACGLCNKTFAECDGLKRHSRVHTGQYFSYDNSLMVPFETYFKHLSLHYR